MTETEMMSLMNGNFYLSLAKEWNKRHGTLYFNEWSAVTFDVVK